MALLQNTVKTMADKPDSSKMTESIFTANQQLNKPTKVSGRSIEVVPKQAEFDPNEAKKVVDFAKSQAVTGSVSGNSLVQNQLDSVLAKNGPLMKRARENAAMATAERGLNNSSIGVQAGEEAAISSALPIAQQDASTYANMDAANLNAQNQFASSGVNQAFTQLNQKNDQIFSANENLKGREQQLLLQGNDQIFSANENLKGREQQLLLQGNDQEFAAGESAAERQMRERQEQLGRENQLLLQGNDQKFSSAERESAQQFSSEEARRAAARQLEGSITMEELTAKNNLALEDIRFEQQQLINSNATAQAIYANHQQAAANIMSQPNISPSQAGAALQILNQTTKDNLALAGALSGVDLSAYAPTGGVGGTSTTDKKGNVTNTFNVTSSSSGGGSQPAITPREQWLREKISVSLPGPRGMKMTKSMTRAEALEKKLIKDTFGG
jgi:hypothetical protein